MIRGVNKNVIEISDTGNECFERAILFVRPELIPQDNDQLRKRAKDYLSGMRLRPWFHPKGKLVLRIAGWVAAAAIGAGITALLLML